MNTIELIQWGLNPKFITPEFLNALGFSQSLPFRFIKQITKSDGCWTWEGSTTSHGYGVLQKGARGEGLIGAHRVSFILHFGVPNDGFNICHSCDNPPCTRPDHLWQGTRKQNMMDMAAKGRAGKVQQRGEQHPNSKITQEIALEILLLRELGAKGVDVAAHFGLHPSEISCIRVGKLWSHVTGLRYI